MMLSRFSFKAWKSSRVAKKESAGRDDLQGQLMAFSPGVLGIQDAPPSPLPRVVLRGVLCLALLMLIWAAFGRLDIVAVAEGKLVPVTYLKIVQPAEAGIVREIKVAEGQFVQEGQVLVHMDANLSDADTKTIHQMMQHKSLELRRIEAELHGQAFKQMEGDDVTLFQKIANEYNADLKALQDNLATERASLQKAKEDLAASVEIQHKLEQVLPNYQAQASAYEELGKSGYAGNLMVLDKQRERIEKEQDLKSQLFNAQSLRASIAQSQKRLAQIESAFKQKLESDHVAIYAEYQKLEQDWARQSHKNSLLELKAPQAGIVKDLATHTPGTVVSPGAVLMTLVPQNEALQAEVWLKNEDAGFVASGQHVKLKLTAYPFQKYGMVDGEVLQVSADATDKNASASQNSPTAENAANASNNGMSSYRTLVALKQQVLSVDQQAFHLSPGMQVAAEIKLADQTVLEYLLSPVRKAFHEAGRER